MTRVIDFVREPITRPTLQRKLQNTLAGRMVAQRKDHDEERDEAL